MSYQLLWAAPIELFNNFMELDDVNCMKRWTFHFLNGCSLVDLATVFLPMCPILVVLTILPACGIIITWPMIRNLYPFVWYAIIFSNHGYSCAWRHYGPRLLFFCTCFISLMWATISTMKQCSSRKATLFSGWYNLCIHSHFYQDSKVLISAMCCCILFVPGNQLEGL